MLDTCVPPQWVCSLGIFLFLVRSSGASLALSDRYRNQPVWLMLIPELLLMLEFGLRLLVVVLADDFAVDASEIAGDGGLAVTKLIVGLREKGEAGSEREGSDAVRSCGRGRSRDLWWEGECSSSLSTSLVVSILSRR